LDARYTSINIIPEKHKRESTLIVEICYQKKGGGVYSRIPVVLNYIIIDFVYFQEK
jgi:hypothetical protein